MLTLFSKLVDNLPVGIVVLDARGRTVVYNRVEELLTGRRREDVLGSDFFRDHGVCMDVPHLAGQFRERIGTGIVEAEAEFSFPFPFLATPREVRVQLTSFEAHGAPYGLLVIRDVSHERSVALMRETLGQMIVHDLKNPLAALAANLHYLDSRVRDDADALEAVADGVAATTRLETMLLTLLDSARLETNTFPLVRGLVDVSALARKAMALVRAVARSREVTLEVVAPAPVLAEVDADVVTRICENLVDNALRKATRVTMTVSQRGADVVLEVADNGPGIPPHERARIFEKYAQATPGAAHSRGLNRGLGLTFVQQGARAHGGDATVEEGPGGGALFRVVLPPARLSPK